MSGPVSTPQAAPREAVDLAGLPDLLGFLIRKAQLWVFQDFIKTLAALDMRPADYAVLSVINANPGLNQISLAGALGIEPGHLVRQLHRLEQRKLLSRIASISDRRSHALHLTDRGRTLLSKSHALVAEQENRLAARVGLQRYKKIKSAFKVFRSI